MNKKLFIVFLTVLSIIVITSCSTERTREGGIITTAIIESTADNRESTVTNSNTEETAQTEDIIDDSMILDRMGSLVKVPSEIKTIISTAPSVTEILVGLGVGSKIIAADLYSADVEGIDPSVCTFDFSALNIEELAAMSPDVIIVSEMTTGGTQDPYQILKDSGVNVVYVPTAESIEDVKLDIEFLAEYTGTTTEGEKLISSINAAVNEITSAVSDLVIKKTVYFELNAAPYLYSFGSETFLDEILTLCGGVNIYWEETGWLSNSEESVLAANPDVIITSVSYDGYDYNEIKSRPGWENLNAVINGQVFLIDSNAISRPSQNIVTGMYQLAGVLYPELFAYYAE